MKTIKTIFAILFLSSMFIACEAESVDAETGIEVEDVFSSEEDDVTVKPS
ncbi:hypothetical protein [Aquimarina sp. MMG016]|nr:hypothetical protein [Aquimarina sp. MMG016]MBQ4821736.1 hypothetical protein [Aquimarina sp. MMG016]